MTTLRSRIFRETESFAIRAVEVFSYQAEHNPVYRRFVDTFGFSQKKVPDDLTEIPLLPIRAFKEARVTTSQSPSPLRFRSSGTTDMERSTHEVYDPTLYEESLYRGFDHFYRDNPIIWACTPGYEDNPESSLIWMLEKLVYRDSSGLSRFLKTGRPLEQQMIEEAAASGRTLILFGAAFGLLDLVEVTRHPLPEGSRIIETGGMKTHRREMSREVLHERLSSGFGLTSEQQVDSEYGMCELLSQAYAMGDSWFETVPWMQVTVRDPDNPLRVLPAGEEGLIGIIDLANLYSCSFILTGDRGVMGPDGTFQVLGRFHQEDLRGCNFLVDRD